MIRIIHLKMCTRQFLERDSEKGIQGEQDSTMQLCDRVIGAIWVALRDDLMFR